MRLADQVVGRRNRMADPIKQNDSLPTLAASLSLQSKLLGFGIEDEPLTSDQWSDQDRARTVKSLPGNTLNQCMTFEHRVPYCWKMFSIPHRFGAVACKFVRPLGQHLTFLRSD
jgi:hypothetical protein